MLRSQLETNLNLNYRFKYINLLFSSFVRINIELI